MSALVAEAAASLLARASRLLPAAHEAVEARATSRIVAGRSPLNAHIAAGLQDVRARFRPTSWPFTNAHAQILLTFLVPQSRAVEYRRELLQLHDGGQAALDWAVPAGSPASEPAAPLPADAPVVVLLHGLTGSSAQLRTLSAAALARGWRPVAVNKRGHGGVALATPKLQAFGCTRDLAEALDRVEARFPLARRRAAVGLSAGAGLLVSYLGEAGRRAKVDAAVLVSPGYDAHTLFCRGGVAPAYDALMTVALKALLLRHARALRGAVDLRGALAAASIREFDRRVFARMHGFGDDLEAYWRANNPVRALGNIRRPVLCLNALDDPVCRREGILYAAIEANARAMLLETAHGSHCAFFQRARAAGPRLLDASWAHDAALTYLELEREFHEAPDRSTAAAAAAAAAP